jgi:hypothetical protein
MIIVLYRGASIGNVDSFPENCNRSRVGAMHLTPFHAYEITDDEWAHIQSVYPNVADFFSVVGDKEPVVPEHVVVPMEQPVVEPTTESIESPAKSYKKPGAKKVSYDSTVFHPPASSQEKA